MGLTQTGKDIKAEADEARRSVPSQFLVKTQDPLSDTFETKVDLLSGDVSRRNAALRKQYDDDHDEREASRAGVLEGRVRDDMFGNRERRLRDQAEQKRRERADTALYLAMLQQRIDELNREIAALDNDIWNVLADHMSDDEMAYLRGIEDKDQQAREQMRLMREKFERGDITSEQFNYFNDFWTAREGKIKLRHETQERVKEITNDRQAAAVVEDMGLTNSEQAAEEVGGQQARMVEKAVEAHADAGGRWTDDVDDFLGPNTDTEKAASPDTARDRASLASTLTTASEFRTAPDVQEAFQTAATTPEEAAPPAKVELALSHDRLASGTYSPVT